MYVKECFAVCVNLKIEENTTLTLIFHTFFCHLETSSHKGW